MPVIVRKLSILDVCGGPGYTCAVIELKIYNSKLETEGISP